MKYPDKRMRHLIKPLGIIPTGYQATAWFLSLKWLLVVSLLSPSKHTDVHGENFIRPPPDLIKEQPEYEIEAIISHWRSRKGQAYLVK